DVPVLHDALARGHDATAQAFLAQALEGSVDEFLAVVDDGIAVRRLGARGEGRQGTTAPAGTPPPTRSQHMNPSGVPAPEHSTRSSASSPPRNSISARVTRDISRRASSSSTGA